MKALIMKELAGTGVFLLAGVICMCTVVLDGGTGGAWNMWVLPRFREAEILMGIALIGGFVLGFAVFFGEQVHRTFEYLAHRPVSLGRIVTSKLLACGVVLMAWLLVPILLQFLFYGLWDPARHLYDPGRIGARLALWTLAFSACAAGCFVGTLRAHPIFRLLLAGVLLLALLDSSWLLMAPRGGATSALPFALFHLTATVLLCLASWWTLREGADPDLPASLGRTGLAGSMLAVVLVMAGGLGIAELQDELRGSLHASYPSMARAPGGELVLRSWVPEQGILLFDRHHDPIPGSGEAAQAASTVWHPSDQRNRVRGGWRWDMSWINDMTGFFGDHRWLASSVAVSGAMRHADAYHDRRDGLVRLYVFGDRWEGIEPRVIVLGKGEEGKPFAGEVIMARVADDAHLLVDRGDDSLWLLDARDPEAGFAPVPLPDGDRFVAPMTLAFAAGDEELAAYPWLDRHNLDFLIRGEDGLYVWQDDGLARAPGPLVRIAQSHGEMETAAGETQEPPVRVVETDMITPVAELLDEDGRAVGRHEYRPSSMAEKVEAGLIYASSLLRAPVLQIASFGSDHHPLDQRTSFEGGNAELIDPLIAGGRHPLTLLLGILLAAACAGSAVVRLRRFGAPFARLLLWGSLLVLGGPLVLLAYYAMERRRAWQATPVRPEVEPPRLLLHTESVTGV